MDLIIIGTAAALALLFPKFKWYMVALACGLLAVLVNWTAFTVMLTPPWWASIPIVGWLYQAQAVFSVWTMAQCFAFAAIEGALVSMIMGLVLKK